MIYAKDDELIDCEYVRRKDFVRGFLTKFFDEIATARARNFTAPPTLNSIAPDNRHSHYYTAAASSEYDDELTPTTADAFGLRTLEYRQLDSIADVPDELKPLLRYKSLKQQCDERHRQMKRIVHDMASGEEERVEAATEKLER